MATSPSAAFLRLRAFIAERMRMSPIDQTLMLKELLGRRSPAPAHNVARRILGSAWWPGFTFNSITAYGDGHDSLIGGDELSDGERDALLELYRQRLDTFREQRGEEVACLLRSLRLRPPQPPPHPDQGLGEIPRSPMHPAPHRSERQGGSHIRETDQQGVGVDG